MKKNKYTLGFKIKENNVLFNSLYGSIDIIENNILYNNILSNNLASIDEDTLNKLKLRNYISTDEEIPLINDIQNNYKNTPRSGKFYIVFSYLCNFKCPYCFEKEIENVSRIDSIKLNKIFDSIKYLIDLNGFQDSEINLYGGEPLLLENKDLINEVFKFSKLNNIKVSIITNGSNIPVFIENLSYYKDLINIISITIDGPKEFNDQRRIYKNNSGSYEKIINSIKLLNQNDINTSIRVNVDKSLKFSYSEFVKTLYEEIGAKIPIRLFKVEDNKCIGNIKNIMSNKDIVQKFSSEDLQYTFNNYNVSSCIRHYNQIKKLIDTPNFTLPLIKYCEIGNLFTFDPSGEIFICPESTGDKNFSIGTYYPKLEIDKNKTDDLFNLSIFTVEKCSNCDLSPICGMGCPYESFNFNNNIKIPKCHYNDIYESIKEYISIEYLG